MEKCKHCGKTFEEDDVIIANLEGLYCSTECAGRDNEYSDYDTWECIRAGDVI